MSNNKKVLNEELSRMKELSGIPVKKTINDPKSFFKKFISKKGNINEGFLDNVASAIQGKSEQGKMAHEILVKMGMTQNPVMAYSVGMSGGGAGPFPNQISDFLLELGGDINTKVPFPSPLPQDHTSGSAFFMEKYTFDFNKEIPTVTTSGKQIWNIQGQKWEIVDKDETTGKVEPLNVEAMKKENDLNPQQFATNVTMISIADAIKKWPGIESSPYGHDKYLKDVLNYMTEKNITKIPKGGKADFEAWQKNVDAKKAAPAQATQPQATPAPAQAAPAQPQAAPVVAEGTKKITINELKSLIKEEAKRIVKENNDFRDMDSSDVAAEHRFDTIGIYEDQLSDLFNFNVIENAYGQYISTAKNELKKLAKAIAGQFSEKDRDNLTSALSSKFLSIPSTGDFRKEKYIKQLVDIAIKKSETINEEESGNLRSKLHTLVGNKMKAEKRSDMYGGVEHHVEEFKKAEKELENFLKENPSMLEFEEEVEEHFMKKLYNEGKEPINEIIGTILGVGAALALGRYAIKKFKNFQKDKNIRPIGKTEAIETPNGDKVVLTKYKDERDEKEYFGLEVMEGGAVADPGYREINTLLFSMDKLPTIKSWISKTGGLEGGPTDMEGGRSYQFDQYFGPFKSDIKISRGTV